MAEKELRHVGGSLAGFRRVLEGWCDLQAKYAAIEEEPAYDNSEAANTSLLVASANAIYGWTSLAESWVEKKKFKDVDDVDSSTTGPGLLDAYFATEDLGYVVELKQAWISLMRDDAIREKSYSALLSEANAQITQLDFKDSFPRKYFTGMYGAFLVPIYDPKKRKPKRRKLFENMVKHCETNFDAFAVFAPALSRWNCTSSMKDGHKSCHRLVALVLNVHGDGEAS